MDFEELYQEPILFSKTENVRISQTPQKNTKIIIPGQPYYNAVLINAIARGFRYCTLAAKRQLPPKERNGYSKKLRKRRFLPPDLIESIMNGTQDPDLRVVDLMKIAEKYWREAK